MQEPIPLNPAENELVEALGALAPTPMGLSSEDVWYRAGLAAGRRRANIWRALAVCVAAVAGISVLRQPAPAVPPSDRVVVIRENPVPPPRAMSTDDHAALVVISTPYLRLRDDLVENGRGRLPAVAAGNGSDPSLQRAWPLPAWALDAASAPQPAHSSTIRGG